MHRLMCILETRAFVLNLWKFLAVSIIKEKNYAIQVSTCRYMELVSHLAAILSLYMSTFKAVSVKLTTFLIFFSYQSQVENRTQESSGMFNVLQINFMYKFLYRIIYSQFLI